MIICQYWKWKQKKERRDHYASTDSSAGAVLIYDIISRCGLIENDILSILNRKEEGREEKEDHSGSTDSSANGAIKNDISSRHGVTENANSW